MMLALFVSAFLGFVAIGFSFLLGEGKGDGAIPSKNAQTGFVAALIVMLLAISSARYL